MLIPAITVGISKLYLLWKPVIPTINVLLSFVCKNTRARRSSFQAHSKLTTARVARAGPESGKTMLRKVRKEDAPSTFADSMMLSGIDLKKFVSI